MWFRRRILFRARVWTDGSKDTTFASGWWYASVLQAASSPALAHTPATLYASQTRPWDAWNINTDDLHWGHCLSATPGSAEAHTALPATTADSDIAQRDAVDARPDDSPATPPCCAAPAPA